METYWAAPRPISSLASYFTEVRVVAVVGDDFTAEHENVLKKRGVDTRGIEHATGKTFRWGGQYHDNLNEAKTDFTELNVFEQFQPRIPRSITTRSFFFWRTFDPSCSRRCADAMQNVKLVGGDTMNYWISGHREKLGEMLKLVDVLLINDTEAKMLAGETNLPRAAQKVLALGPQALVIKHGEYGATIFFPRRGIRHRTPSLPRSRLAG